MSAIMKAALITLMLERKCAVEKVDPPETADGYWHVVFQCPNKIGTTFRNMGSGRTECAALVDCMTKAGVYDLKTRLFVLGFMVEHIAQRTAPGLLRRLENGSA